MTGEPSALPREEWYDFFEWAPQGARGAETVFVDQSLPGIAYAISVEGADATQTLVTLYAREGDEP